MKACCCVLPYMNPDACKHCGNYEPPSEFRVMPLTQLEKHIFNPTTTREIIERFDKDGKLIERITKEI